MQKQREIQGLKKLRRDPRHPTGTGNPIGESKYTKRVAKRLQARRSGFGAVRNARGYHNPGSQKK